MDVLYGYSGSLWMQPSRKLSRVWRSLKSLRRMVAVLLLAWGRRARQVQRRMPILLSTHFLRDWRRLIDR